MTISTFDGLIAAAKQIAPITRTASRVSTATTPWSVFDLAGNPGAGVLGGTSTAAGVVPTNATAGCISLNAFGGGATGYLSSVDFGSTVACRITLCDVLFKAGAYAFNAAVSLSAQPSYSGRVPGGTDYKGLQIWYECVTAITTNQSLAVTYTDQTGTGTGHTTGTVAFGLAPTLGRMIQMPLASGDSGVSVIESVTSTGATVGTFNILVLRPLWTGRVKFAGDGDVHGPDKTGLPVVFATSALMIYVTPDSTATGIPDLQVEIVNG